MSYPYPDVIEGRPGIQGPKGDKGDKGDRGPMGLEGPEGPQGERGPRGEQGIQGFEGPRGQRGAMGFEGQRGKDGKPGAKGDKGDKGADGKDGVSPNIEQFFHVANQKVADHEKKFDHDPFLLGTKKITEAGIEDGMVIQYDAKANRLHYVKPKTETTSRMSGRGLSLPSQSGNAGKVLTTDGQRASWGTAGAGTGDVVGPASAIDNNFASFDLTTGKLIQDSGFSSASFAAALGSDDNYVTDAEKTIIGNTLGTNTGDQSVFKTIAVSGQDSVVADTTTDTLTLVAGSNISLTTNAAGDSITITGTGSGGSGITRSVNVISSNTTAGATAATDYVYLVSGTTTLTMPTAVGNTNRYTVKNTGVATVTVAFDGVETGDGSTTLSLLPNVSVDLISDDTNFFII